MANPSDTNSEEFKKGTEDLQAIADDVEREREGQAARQSGVDSDEAETDGVDEALDAPEEERDIPMGSVNRVTHQGGHLT